jgi:hypothetical protein
MKCKIKESKVVMKGSYKDVIKGIVKSHDE